MAKDDASGGLLSKVARFVRHPTVDWRDLDAHTAAVDAEREALKAAIQRKRRNDQVRHRELNALRALMRQQQAPSRHPESEPPADATPSQPPSPEGDKSRTIEQIARIEEQMAANWLQRGAGDTVPDVLHIGSGTTIPARLEGGVTVPAHLQARAGEASDFSMTIDVVTLDPHVDEWDGALSHPAVAEAAVRFANGQNEATEQALRSLLVQEGLSPTARVAGGVLLDFLYAQGDLEAFEEYAAEHAERFGLPVPRWPAPPPAPVVAQPAGAPAASPGLQAWICPLLLDAAAVTDLHRLVAGAGEDKWLDWTDLVSADLPAAQALLAVVEGWLQQPIEFHFRGAVVLRRRLKASTPSGRSENDPVWWLLRLALLRLMHRRDEFDLAALDYCVTYGVLPPEWVEPVCRFQLAETMPAGALPLAGGEPQDLTTEPIQPLDTQLAGLEVMEWPSMVSTLSGSDTQFPALPTQPAEPWTVTEPLRPAAGVRAAAALSGELQGDVPQTLAMLDTALAAHPIDQPFLLDCHALQRVDFAAAGSLLQWFMATTSRGLKIELDGVSRLVGAFFHVVGVDEAVTVRLRQY